MSLNHIQRPGLVCIATLALHLVTIEYKEAVLSLLLPTIYFYGSRVIGQGMNSSQKFEGKFISGIITYDLKKKDGQS